MWGGKRLGCPPMMASISGRRYRAARITDCWLPPTPTHVGRCPPGRGGLTYWSVSGDRVVPDHVTGWSRSRRVVVDDPPAEHNSATHDRRSRRHVVVAGRHVA